MARFLFAIALLSSSAGATRTEVTTAENGPSQKADSRQRIAAAGGTATDLVLTVTASPDPVQVGANLTYTINVQNDGPSDAFDVVVTDVLSYAVTLVSTSGCNEDPVGVPTCTLGTITAGTSSQYTIVVTVDQGEYGTGEPIGGVTNRAEVSSSTSLVNPEDDSVVTRTATFIDPAPADLSVTLADSPDPALTGTDVYYTVEVRNDGPSTATQVVLSVAVAAGRTANLDTTVGWICTPQIGDIFECLLPSLAPGTSPPVVFSVNAGPVPDTATFRAFASSDNLDPTWPNVASEESQTVAEVDLSITKTDGLTTAGPGDPVTYTLVVTNAGPDIPLSATVTDLFPAALQGVSWTCSATPNSTCPAAGAGDLTAVAVDLAVDGSATFLATGTISPTFTGELVNTASVAPGAGFVDIDDTNDIAMDTTSVVSPAALTATKEVTGEARAGGAVFYTIVLSNAGPGAQLDNPGDELVDVLPPELILLAATADSGTALANLGTNTVTWNGSIPPLGQVTITIDAEIAEGASGQTIANQAELAFDADGDGSNEATARSDDPADGGPTLLRVALVVPTLGEIGLLLLGLLVGATGLTLVRRQPG